MNKSNENFRSKYLQNIRKKKAIDSPLQCRSSNAKKDISKFTKCVQYHKNTNEVHHTEEKCKFSRVSCGFRNSIPQGIFIECGFQKSRKVFSLKF